jgi:hypothetical protein
MFWNYYVLKPIRLETITFSDAKLIDIKIVLCYVLSPYRYGKGLAELIPERHKRLQIWALFSHRTAKLVKNWIQRVSQCSSYALNSS